MIGDLLLFLGCKDEQQFARLREHDSLDAAWDEAEPQDLAWIAARCANELRERAIVARTMIFCVETLSASEDGHGAAHRALALTEIALVEPERTAFVIAELAGQFGDARRALLAIERTQKGRARTAPIAERAIHAAIEAAWLLLRDGWRGKAATRAQLAIATTAALGDPVELGRTLRGEIEFAAFRTSWRTAIPPRVTREG